jgi:hypothetical protein
MGTDLVFSFDAVWNVGTQKFDSNEFPEVVFCSDCDDTVDAMPIDLDTEEGNSHD